MKIFQLKEAIQCEKLRKHFGRNLSRKNVTTSLKATNIIAVL